MRRLVFLLCFFPLLGWSSQGHHEPPKTPNTSLILFPENCMGHEVCGVKNKVKYEFTTDQGQIVAGVNSEFVLSKDQLQLIKGRLLVKSGTIQSVQSPFGLIEVKNGEALIIQEKERTKVYSLSGETLLRLYGYDEPLNVPAAFEVWFSGVLSSGYSEVSIPQPAQARVVISQWASLSSLSSKEFSHSLQMYKDHWKNAGVSQGHTFEQVSLRNIANHRKKLANLKARRARVEKENRALRALFRRKNYLD